jgi:hypothetical protein
VLSRPGAVLPSPELGDRVVEVQVQPFAAPQIEDWLTRWNTASSDGADRGAAATPPLSLAELQQRGVAELATTPILLFMLAFTWAEYANQQEKLSKATLYEHFFRQLARGKAEGDQDVHKPIRDASARLLDALRSQDLLPEGATSIDAMLWLMARVAWEAYKLEQQQREFDSHNVEQLLRDTFGREVPKESLELILLGLVLALQADLRASNHTILFGHKSFREFLVGYYWASQLRRMVRSREKDWDDLATKWLLGGRLLGTEDQSFDFLMQLINRSVAPRDGLLWIDADRSALVRWAEDTFNDERQQFSSAGGSREDVSLRHDQRAVLREAALAIGSLTKSSLGVKPKDPLTLRSLLAWFWLLRRGVILLAPNIHFREANLQRANLQGAFLQGAILQGLQGAILQDANLQDANLQDANLQDARLQEANLSGADLRKLDLREAHLAGVILQRQRTADDPTGPEHIYAIFDETTLWPEGFPVPTLPTPDLAPQQP